MTIKQIEGLLAQKGYYLVGLDVGSAALRRKEGKITARKSAYDYEINDIDFVLEDLPNCCGVQELGDLRVENFVNLSKENKEATILMIQAVLLKSKSPNNRRASKDGIQTTKAICMVSNGDAGWVLVEEALKGLPKDFQLVSKTRNPRSKNILKFYAGIY